MIDGAGNHEERTLEQRVGEQIRHRRLDRLVVAEPNQEHQEA